MTLSAAGVQNYNNDLIQTITYNENNDPVQINGEKNRVHFDYGLGSMRQRVDISKLKETGGSSSGMFSTMSTNGIWDPNAPVWENKQTNFYSEDGSFEVVSIPLTSYERHILYIAGTPYESNIVYLKDYKESAGSYKYLHKDYLGSILAITDEEGNKLEGRHYDAWGNFTHLKKENGPIVTDKATLASADLLIDRGYTSHEHFMQVGIIHMNGRLYDPLLRRFLNADENIQDPSNTQNYNKYGYVMNNPLMYSDPNGEFWWMAIGAIVGGYLNGVHANNGNWNPGKWDWKNNWRAVLGGAIGGASIAGALGNITSNPGAIKNMLPSIVSGGLNSAFSGSNFLSGMISGISYSANVFNNTVTSTDRINYAEGSTLNQKYNSGTSTTIGKNLLAGFLVANGIMPYDPATLESLNNIISLFSSVGDWIKIGDAVTVADFSKGYLNYTINPTTKYLELYINGRIDTQAWGVTNPINGKIILSPRLIDGIYDNFWGASIVIHERKHFSNFKMGIDQGNNYIDNQLDELSSYMEAASWTGTMEKQGYTHWQNVIDYFLNRSKF